MTQVIIKAERESYEPEQVRNTMTVSEFIDALSDLDPDAKVYFSFDDRYTYGGVTYPRISEEPVEGVYDIYINGELEYQGISIEKELANVETLREMLRDINADEHDKTILELIDNGAEVYFEEQDY